MEIFIPKKELVCKNRRRSPLGLLRVVKMMLILMTICMHLSAHGYSQLINFTGKDVPLSAFLSSVEKQTGYAFFFNNALIKNAKPITLDIHGVQMEDALKRVLNLQGLDFYINGKTVFVVKQKAVYMVSEQEGDRGPISGTVRGVNGVLLEGATVSLKGMDRHVLTNKYGEFVFTDIPPGEYELDVTYVGYQQEIRKVVIGEKSMVVSFDMKSLNSMEDTVVKGYYNTTKILNTGDVTTIKADVIQNQPINNPLLALEGRVAGMIVTQSSGLPGSPVGVVIRGRGSITQGTDPLYIIDGVPYTNNLFPAGSGGLSGTNLGGGINPLSFINPQDIASISILKDADATSIYGSRGANGVILITTKTGKIGSMQFDLNAQTGFGNIARKAHLMNTPQYLAMRKQAWADDGVTPSTNYAGIVEDLLSYSQTRYTDWEKVFIGGTSQYSDVQGTLSGGGNNTQYLFGGSYHRETTVFPGSWKDEKMSFHFNVDNTSVDRKFKVNLSGSFLSDNNRLPSVDYTQFIILAPNAPSLYLPNGKLDWTDFPANPFQQKFSKYQAQTTNLISNLMLSYMLLPSLELKSNFGYNAIHLNENQGFDFGYYNPAYNITTTNANFNNNTLSSWIVEPQINYQKNIGKGVLNALIGATIQHRDDNGQSVSGVGYPDDALLVSLAAASNIYKGPTAYEQYNYVSLFGRLGYEWEQKYVVNLTVRRDGSSRFGPGNQYGNFGSAGGAWVFSNENFVKHLIPSLSFGKIRASYGVTGNEPGSSYQYLELYRFLANGLNSYEGGVGISPTGLPAPDYHWEVDKKLEGGIELGFLKNRLNVTASYYRNRSGNQITSYHLPAITGFSSIAANLPAVIQNSGWEFTVNTVNIKSKNFSWVTDFNITAARNKLVSFPNLQNTPYAYYLIVGKPLTFNKVFKSAGIDPNTGLYQFYDKNGHITTTPTYGVDNTEAVDLNPKYYGGINNTFSYKGFQLQLLFQFVSQKGQNYLYSSLLPGVFSGGDNIGNLPVQYNNTWTPSNTKAPLGILTATVLNDPYNSYSYAQASDRIFTDASFIRCKNVSFSYNLATSFLKKCSIRSFKIYVLAQNLFVISGYKGVDPESQSVTFLPPLRVVTGGIQVKF